MEKKKMRFNKIIYVSTFFMGLMIPTWALAENFVQPIIQGQVYKTWTVNPKVFGKPVHVLKGAEDECNGGYFPDQYQFKNFSLFSNGQIQSVYLAQNNGLFFHNERISATLNKAQFVKKFQKYVRKDSDNPNILHADASDDSNDSITFVFNNTQLLKYQLHVDNC